MAIRQTVDIKIQRSAEMSSILQRHHRYQQKLQVLSDSYITSYLVLQTEYHRQEETMHQLLFPCNPIIYSFPPTSEAISAANSEKDNIKILKVGSTQTRSLSMNDVWSWLSWPIK